MFREGIQTEHTTAVYQFHGDIKHLRIRVTLHKRHCQNDISCTHSRKEDNVISAILGWETHDTNCQMLHLKPKDDDYETQTLTTSMKEARTFITHARRREKHLKNVVSKVIVVSFAEDDQQTLVELRLCQNSCLEMTPGFSQDSEQYSILSNCGTLYTYWIEDVSPQGNEIAQNVGRSSVVKRNFLLFSERASLEAVTLLFMCEIHSLSGFKGGRHLHIKYELLYDSEIWNCKNFHPFQSDSSTKGATQFQKPKCTSKLLFWKEKVCFLSHPIEALLEAEKDPGNCRWPSLILAVYSTDGKGNEFCEGYAWISLFQLVPGFKETVLTTWKPQNTGFARLKQILKGGTSELKNVEGVGLPLQPSSVLVKYGLTTQASGVIKIRSTAVAQCYGEEEQKSFQETVKKDMTWFKDPGLVAVLRKAEYRLQQAGKEKTFALDLPQQIPLSGHCQSPVIISQPCKDIRVKEGQPLLINIQAKGHEPLHYQWYKDEEQIFSSNAKTSAFEIPEVQKSNRGVYICKVSNKRGACQSSPCRVHVMTKRKTQKTENQNKQSD